MLISFDQFRILLVYSFNSINRLELYCDDSGMTGKTDK